MAEPGKREGPETDASANDGGNGCDTAGDRAGGRAVNGFAAADVGTRNTLLILRKGGPPTRPETPTRVYHPGPRSGVFFFLSSLLFRCLRLLHLRCFFLRPFLPRRRARSSYVFRPSRTERKALPRSLPHSASPSAPRCSVPGGNSSEPISGGT